MISWKTNQIDSVRLEKDEYTSEMKVADKTSFWDNALCFNYGKMTLFLFRWWIKSQKKCTQMFQNRTRRAKKSTLLFRDYRYRYSCLNQIIYKFYRLLVGILVSNVNPNR